MPSVTERDQVPVGWAVKSLVDVAEKIMVGIASAATHAYRQHGIPMFRNQNIKAGKLDDLDLLFIAPEYEAAFRNKRLRSGDLLTMRTGYPGVTAIVPAQYDSAQSFTTLITRLKKSEVDAEFLCHYINSHYGQTFFVQSQIGGAQKNVNAGTLRLMPLLLPLKEEQRAIATALSDVDALIAGLEKLIAKKRDLKQAAMQQLLTGQTRLPGFSGGWVTKRLSELAELYQPTTIAASEFTDFGYPVYGANGVVGFFSQKNHSTWQVTVTCRGSTCGTVNRTVDECWITGNAMVLYCDENIALNKEFFYHLLSHQDLSGCISGTGQPQIVRSPLAAFGVTLPASIDEQIAIATVLSDMDAEIIALEARLAKTRFLKQGMMQELLTGKTRLV